MNIDLNKVSPIEFEHICKFILEKAGFQVETTKTVGDGGIDLIAFKTDLFTSGKYIIQCKRYQGSVGEPVLRDLYGVVTAESANKGILMTTGTFTSSAIAFAKEKPLELINGDMLHKILDDIDDISEISHYVEDFFPVCILDDLPIEDIHSRYKAYKNLLKDDKLNINYIGHLMSMLSDCIFCDFDYLQMNNDFSYDYILKNKFQSINEIYSLVDQLSEEKIFRIFVTCWKAQINFLMGNMLEALKLYKQLLKDPQNLEDWNNNNAFDACSIVQNIAFIYKICGFKDKAVEFKANNAKYIQKAQKINNQIIESDNNIVMVKLAKKRNTFHYYSMDVPDIFFLYKYPFTTSFDDVSKLVHVYKEAQFKRKCISILFYDHQYVVTDENGKKIILCENTHYGYDEIIPISLEKINEEVLAMIKVL